MPQEIRKAMPIIGAFIDFVLLILLILYLVYRWIMRQSAKEENFWNNRKIFHSKDVFTAIYAAAKIVLLIAVIISAILLFTSLAYGHTPVMRDFTNPDFLAILACVTILAIPQCGIILLIRSSGKHRKPGPLGVMFILGILAIILTLLFFLIYFLALIVK